MTYRNIKAWLDVLAPKNKPKVQFEKAHDEREMDRKLTRINQENLDYEIFYEERVVAL